MFFLSERTKILVALGDNGEYLNDVEIIDLAFTETVCQPLQNFPYINVASNGEIGLDNIPIICGGSRNDQACQMYTNGKWEVGPTMNYERSEAAMVKSGHGLIVSGGYFNSYTSTQEILTTSGWKEIVSLPKPVAGHCIVNLNSTHIMSIGGYDNNYFTDVNILNLNDEHWTIGPSLRKARFDHSCGKIMTEDGQEAIIVIGGYDVGNSVEVLMPGDNEWIEGPNLPISISEAQLVQDPSGGVVLIGGYSDKSLNTLYRLSSLKRGWELMTQKLKTARFEHTAFLIDDELTTCTKSK